MKVVIIGRGRVGRGLTQALRQADMEVTLTAGHSPRRAAIRHSDVTLICTSDPAISATAKTITPWLPPGSSLLHCAGSHGPDLVDVGDGAVSPGVLHPLVSFPPAGTRTNLAGSVWVIDGAARAVRDAKALAHAVGARAVLSDIHGSAYHAIAALAANGTAALIGAGVPGLESIGMNRREAEVALARLLRTVAENIETVGLPAALTGPVVRGDVQTVRNHRAALEGAPEVTRSAYDALLPLILSLAEAADLPPSKARAIRRLIKP